MLGDLVESLFSPATVLWLIVSAMAAAILFGSLNRRRSSLTEILKAYVSRSQSQPAKKSSPDKNAAASDKTKAN